MTTAKDIFETDLILGPRRRERIAYMVAGIGVVIGLTGFLGALSLLPLKTTQTHVVVVDKSSGQLDRVPPPHPYTHTPLY